MPKSYTDVAELSAEKRELLELLLQEEGQQYNSFPLSFAQQRLWFLSQLEPDSAFYNISAAVRLSGRLDVEKLAQAINEVVRRHEALRTTFTTFDGQAVQSIGPELTVPLPLIELHDLPREERELKTQQLVVEEARRPFNLSQGPLLRAMLLRLGEEEHVATLTMHHIISDRWSIGILIREVVLLYEAFLKGEASPLPELPIQYADFAVWQREWVREHLPESHLDYWKRHLAGAPVLQLPTDRPRPVRQSFRGATYTFELAAQSVRALNALSQREGVTQFMTLLAIFKVLLWRYSGQRDIVVGTPVAARNRSETEALIGFFVNTLALRTELDGGLSFQELLRRVREVTLSAFAHQDVPFEKLVEELQPERSLSHSPLFQVMLVLENTPFAEAEMAGLRMSPMEVDTQTAKFDLMLALEERRGGMKAAFEYNTDLFEPATIARLAVHFQNLVESVIADPGQPISELALLTEAELHQLLVGWNQTRLDYPRAGSMLSLFEAQATRSPDAPALLTDASTLTYRQLDEEANRLAHYLRALGVGPEQRVAVLLARTPKLVVALLAVLKAGGAYVPLDASYPEQRLRFMLEDAGACLLVSEQALLDSSPLAASFAAEASHPEMPPADTSSPADMSSPGAAMPRLLCLDREHEAIAAMSDQPPPTLTSASNLAYLIYTSGSTGRPKAVAIEHASASALLHWALAAFAPHELSLVLASTSICFDLSVFELFAPLSTGGSLLLAQDALQLPMLRRGAGVTLINTVPSAMAELLRLGGVPETATAINLAGEALSGRLVRRIYSQTRARVVRNLYGPSEDTTYSTCAEVGRGEGGEPTIGRPIANTQAYVLDAGMRPVPVGVVGELYIGGEGLARGYLGRPALTAERFVPHPFGEGGQRLYRTGDVARWRGDGELEFLGRKDGQVKVRGYRIELGEVESVLCAHASVAEAAVVAAGGEASGVRGEASSQTHQNGGERLVAYVVGRSGEERVVSSELRAHMLRSLPEYMAPWQYVWVEALPLTANGKVDRRALGERARGGEGSTAAAGGYVRPRGVTEEVLAEVWGGVLGLEEVSAEGNFFELGGHSLLAVQVVSRVRERFGVEVGVRAVFERPTVAALAALIESEMRAGRQSQAPPIVPLKREGKLALSFAQERLLFLEQLEPGGAVYNLPAALRLRGPLNVEALEQSLNEIVRRHEILRTTFATVEGEQTQVIADALTLNVPVLDLSDRPEPEREAEARRLLAEEGRRPFDLNRGPLVRVSLIRLDSEDHMALLTLHHIISDGWSMGVLLREVGALYGAYNRGEASPLEELPVQYADYAAWQREWLRGEALETQLAYWREQLAGAPPVLELPADRVRAAVRSFRGATETLVLDEELSRRLKRLSRDEGATLFMTLLAAFKILLARYTGQKEIVVGTPIANRNCIETEALIGLFLNSLALRTDLSGSPSFRGLLRRVSDVTLSAYAHQDVPFEKLLEELQPERDLSRTPLFQVFFNMLNFPFDNLELPGLAVELLSSPEEWSKFDLTLYVRDEKGIRLNLVYNADLFAPPRMAEMLEQFKYLLTQIVEDPDAEITRYGLVTTASEKFLPSPKSELDAKWEGGVHALFSEQARRVPNKAAVIDKDGAWTYAELESRSNRLANYLRAGGLQTEDVVAIYADRSAALVWALLGVMKAGASFFILDPAYPARRLLECLEQARPKGWLQLRDASALPESLKDFAASCAPCYLELPRHGAFDGQGPLADFSADDPQVTVSADGRAYLAFTSGTSGRPKGIEGRHGPLTHFRRWYEQRFGIDESDRFSMLSGLSHDPLHRDVFTPLQFGATVCIPDPETLGTSAQLAGWMLREQITVANLTPAMGQLLTAELPSDPRPEIATLRYAFFVGDALTRSDVSRLKRLAPRVTCINLYGSTETQRAVSSFVVPDGEDYDTSGEKEILPLGKGIDDVQLIILNESGGLAGVGELGEVCIRSPHLARGYLNDEALTSARFITNPFTGSALDRLYRTGDLGRYQPDGNVVSLGRSDFQVKVRGFRVELTEIEAVLSRHEALKEAAVIASDDGAGEKRLIAFVVTRPGGAASGGELRRFVKERLPEYMVPAFFIALDELPLTPNGKLDRRGLEALGRTHAEQAERGLSPRTPTEEILAGIWSEVLRVGAVDVQRNFFELGGHSLLIARVVSRVRESFQIEMPLRTLFERPTVAELAEAVERLRRAEGAPTLPPIRPARRDAPLPLSFAQQRLWFIDQLEASTAAYNLPAAMWFTGALDVEALTRTLNEMARRHEVLRTNFVSVEGRPHQVIAPDAKVVVTLTDLSHLPETEREAEARRLALAEAARPFDLAREPLWRASLLRFGAESHVGLFTMHHIVSDAWSFEILVREVAALYEAFSQGKPSPLEELPIQYADYAAWQREWLRGEVLEKQLAYWREHLAGIPTLRLPTDRPRSAVASRGFSGMKHPFELSGELSEAVREFGRREGLTLFMTTLACFKVLLHYLSGQRDIVVGTDVANRNRAELEGLIGFFVNQLVLRTRLAGRLSFRELSRRVREVALQAYAHQDVPFEKLVEAIRPGRRQKHATLFQVKFMLQDARERELKLAGLTLDPLKVENELMDMDLIISLYDTSKGLRGWINGDTQLFEAATVKRFSKLFEALLQYAVVNPERSIDELVKFLADADRHLQTAEKARREENKLKRFRSIKPSSVSLNPEGGRAGQD